MGFALIFNREIYQVSHFIPKLKGACAGLFLYSLELFALYVGFALIFNREIYQVSHFIPKLKGACIGLFLLKITFELVERVVTFIC